MDYYQLNTGLIFSSGKSFKEFVSDKKNILEETYISSENYTGVVKDFTFSLKDVICNWKHS